MKVGYFNYDGIFVWRENEVNLRLNQNQGVLQGLSKIITCKYAVKDVILLYINIEVQNA